MASTHVSGLITERGIRERSPGHFELAAFNPATKRQVFKTYVAPRGERGSGIRAARRELSKLQTEIAEGKYGGKRATVAYLLDEFLTYSESRGRSPSTLGGYRSNAAQIKAGPLANKQVT